ncbi:DUF262 domain-containing protein [Mucilaginibacter phyllosphaerae]
MAGKEKSYQLSGIQVPMIQRDYAQGRPEEKEIRRRLLKAIFDALCNGEELELDFVYGSIPTIDDGLYFIPLDGQQRLTTLFLLHWYIGHRELDKEPLKALQENVLSRFSYHTRVTSRRFCEELCKLKKVDFKVTPEAYISGRAWFYESFKKDPTVMSMLHMLNAIHRVYNERQQQVFDRLSLLKFYILPLEDFGLSDELYIKMNARGKQLTDFENFKADLFKWMKDEQTPGADEFQKKITYDHREMRYYLSFGLKMDNEWCNFFWGYSKLEETPSKLATDKLVDPFFMRFYNRYLLNRYIANSPLNAEAVEKSAAFRFLYGREGSDTEIKYQHFEAYETHFNTFEVVKDIENILDRFIRDHKQISVMLAPSWSLYDRWNFFDKSVNQRQRMLFLGMSLYLERFDLDVTAFRRWIRVVWNIIADPDIRSIPPMIGVMKVLAELAPYANNVYGFLATGTVLNNHTVFPQQLEEETLKAKLILDDPDWETALIEGESHGLFMGNIGFLLRGDPSLETYRHRLKMAAMLFTDKGSAPECRKGFRLIRAVISKFRVFHNLFPTKLADSFENWQLILRRNTEVKAIIAELTDIEDEQLLGAEIDRTVNAPSAITGYVASNPNRRYKHVHEQLYRLAGFHAWMQQESAVDLKELGERIFIRKKSSWFAWVMLDVYRNEIITEMIRQFGFTFKDRCGDSNLYFNKDITLLLPYGNLNISAEFNEGRMLKIGLREVDNQLENFAPAFNASDGKFNWHAVAGWRYDEVRPETLPEFLAEIDQKIFELSNPESLLSKVRLAVPGLVPPMDS